MSKSEHLTPNDPYNRTRFISWIVVGLGRNFRILRNLNFDSILDEGQKEREIIVAEN